jgi:DNA-directed RNA polymerase subunit L
MIEEEMIKLAIISGASHALDYRDRKPNSSEEEVVQFVSDETNTILQKIEETILRKEKARLAIVTGASRAINFKEKSPRATTKEIIRQVSEESADLLKNIQNGED